MIFHDIGHTKCGTWSVKTWTRTAIVRVIMLKMFPMVPTTPVMKVRTPEIINLYRSITSEYSSRTPHLEAIATKNIEY